MATRIEQTTNDLLHFSGKYNPTKFRAKNDTRKVLLRAYSREQFWSIRASDFSLNTHNPIRAIVDGLKIEPNKDNDKEFIALSIGKSGCTNIIKFVTYVTCCENKFYYHHSTIDH